MIILDEQLKPSTKHAILDFYPGAVISMTEFTLGRGFDDARIARLLHQHAFCTFITINCDDFWKDRACPPHSRYCVVCFELRSETESNLPGLLKRLLNLPPFDTRRGRCGHLIRVSESRLEYFRQHESRRFTLPW